MQLKIKLLKWSAGLPVTMFNKKTASKMGVHPKDMITVKTLSRNPVEIAAVVDVIEGKLVKEGEVAISSELKKQLGLRVNEKVEINMLTPPESMDYIKKKMKGKTLDKEEINSIIKDIVNNSLSDSEIALFISSMDRYGMNTKETISLIKAIQKTGKEMKFREKFVVDKHSIGGVPGNRTTPIVVSICAAAGLIFPKNSSRAITSAAGTADVIETVAKVEFPIKEVKKIVKKTGACLVWGGSVGMVPADSKIIRIEKSLKIDPQAQLIASIMSKKLAAGSKYILIDIPYGFGAKVGKSEALKLKGKFENLGRYFNLKIKCVLTNGSQPIGNGLGPGLELKDVIKVMDPNQEGPWDLEKKSIFLSGEIFEMTGKAKKGEGEEMALKVLESGEALKKFEEIIKAQSGSLSKLNGKSLTRNIVSKKSGKIKKIDNKKITSLARTAGCPLDKFSGVYLHKKRGDKVKKGQKLITIYAESKLRINSAAKYYREANPIKIG